MKWNKGTHHARLVTTAAPRMPFDNNAHTRAFE
jgi:hypothetical protein